LLAFYSRYLIWHLGLLSNDAFRPELFELFEFSKLALAIAPVFIALFAWSGLYSFKSPTKGGKLRIISFSALAGVMFFVLIFFAQRQFFFSRSVVALTFFWVTFLVFTFHWLLTLADQTRWRHQVNITRILIIGANKAAEKTIKHLLSSATPLKPVAIIAPFGSKKKQIEGVEVVGKLNYLEQTVKDYEIDGIFQCDAVEQSLNLLLFAEDNFLEFYLSPAIIGAYNQQIQSETIASMPVLTLKATPLFGWGQVFKRLFDLLLATLLIIIVTPFLLLVGIIRKLIAPHRSFITTEKRAKGIEAEFSMVRLTARKNRAWERFLRHSFLKNLPQIYNVFKGEMSFVGPLPLKLSERESLPFHYQKRLILKPGMTGYWQIERLKGQDFDFNTMIEHDIHYILNWSFMQDLKILALTFIWFWRNLFRHHKGKNSSDQN
jgi:lipopolysaccharide/colanic/teichoic acid biosynthesis glycosyltransferase